MQKKFLALPLMVGILSVGALTSCGTPKEWKGRFTLRETSEASPSTWNPHTWETNTDSMIMGYTEMGFVDFVYEQREDGSEGYKVVPEMAAELPHQAAITAEEKELYGYTQADVDAGAESGLKWVIDLNQGAKFENGTVIDADTYIYSMQQMLNPLMKNHRASSYYSGDLALANAEMFYKSDGKENYVLNGTYGEYVVHADKHYFSLYEPSSGFGDSLFAIVGATGNDLDSLKEFSPKLSALFEDTERFGTVDSPKDVELTDANHAEIFEATKEFVAKATGGLQLVDDVAPGGLNFGEFLLQKAIFNLDFANVGIKKTGDYQITLFLLSPIDTFNLHLSLTSNWLVYEDLYEAGRTSTGSLEATNYATSKETYMAYGPYKLTSYQLDKQIKLERNEKWYGWTDGKHEGQFQTTNIDIQIVKEHAAELLLFEQGECDSVALLGNDMNKYRTSSNILYTPQSYTTKVSFNSSFEKLKANQEKDPKKTNINKTVLSNRDFREGLSWSINRLDFAKSMTAGSGVGLVPINSSYIADSETGLKYRDTEQAKQVIKNVYGESTTGYDLAKAVEFLNKAYDAEMASTKEGSLKANQKVELLWEVYNEGWMDYINYYVDNMKAALAASKFGTNEDGVTFDIVTAVVGDVYSDHIKGGTIEMGISTYGGAIFDPYGVLEVYDSPSYSYEPGFNGTSLSVTVPSILDEEGKPVKKSFHAWYEALCKGEYKLAPMETRVDILAACEEALVKEFVFASIYSRQSVSLYSDKIRYVTENYNDIYGYGGIRFMTYEYDDFDWVKVAKKLDYTK